MLMFVLMHVTFNSIVIILYYRRTVTQLIELLI